MKIFNKNLKTQRLELRILEPTTANAERLLSVINENREFLEWVDGYATAEKTDQNIA